MPDFSDQKSTVLSVIIFSGILVIFCYCFFIINFIPTGLTLGDSITYIFCALGFGIFYSLWLFLGIGFAHSCLYPFSEKMRGTDKLKNSDLALYLFHAIIYFLFLLLVYAKSNDLNSILTPIFSGFGLVTLYYWSPKSGYFRSNSVARKNKIQRTIIASLLIISPFVVSTSISSSLLKHVMKNVGIRDENTSIVVNKDDYDYINKIAKQFDAKIFACESESSNNKYRYIHNVNILWGSVGSKTLIEVPVISDSGIELIKLDLNTDNVKKAKFQTIPALQSTDSKSTDQKNTDPKNTIKSCISLDSASMFDNNSSELNGAGKIQINDLINKINTYLKKTSLSLTSIKITGYTDKSPINKHGDSNDKLSERRASSVSSLISHSLDEQQKSNPKIKPIINGVGSKYATANCSTNLPHMELIECRSIDRKVDVSFSFEKIK